MTWPVYAGGVNWKWIFWLGLSGVAAAQSLTLPEALRRAQASNPEVIAAERNVSVVRTGVTIAGGRPNPRLAFEQPLDGTAQTKSSLRVEVPLELGGRRSARLVVAEDQVEYAQQQVSLLRWQTRTLAMQAYYDAISAGLNLAQLQQAGDLAGPLG